MTVLDATRFFDWSKIKNLSLEIVWAGKIRTVYCRIDFELRESKLLVDVDVLIPF